MHGLLVVAALVAGASGQLYFGNRQKLEELAAAVNNSGADEPQVKDQSFVHPKLCDPSVNQTAGYIGINALTSYFFWLFESRDSPTTDPLIMWLSGGPGCSSQLALFAENGPCKVSKDGSSTFANPSSWHMKANVMWVDQPAGVGFSTGLGTHDEAGVAENMYIFLQTFFQRFPQYQKLPFYIFGESYAGHYVPAIAHRILLSNATSDSQRVPLAGIAIGNGLTHPAEQYKWYPEMGRFGGQQEGGHAPAGVISKGDYVIMKGLVGPCLLGIAACNRGVDPDPKTGGAINKTACVAALDACNLMSVFPYELTGKNPYDMRIPCAHGRLCYDFDMITTYLNGKDVQSQLGVKKRWGSCNLAVDLLFIADGDWLINYQTLIPDLLHGGIEVLIYAGDVDYICNWLGNKAWTTKLDWEHGADFRAAPDQDWRVEGGSAAAAKLRSASGLHFMQVFEAGHMVPMDQPKVALEMVNAFVRGRLQDGAAATAAGGQELIV